MSLALAGMDCTTTPGVVDAVPPRRVAKVPDPQLSFPAFGNLNCGRRDLDFLLIASALLVLTRVVIVHGLGEGNKGLAE